MSEYTIEELLSCEVSKHLLDGEMGFIGVGTGGGAFLAAIGIPAVASRLAQLTHAPNYMVMFGSIVDPFLDGEFLPRTTYDDDLIHWKCRSQLNFEDALAVFKTGRMGVGFVTSEQIDAHGALNITAIGDYRKPQVRLPGPLAQPDHCAHAKRVFVIMPHSKRAFVDSVDCVSSSGAREREGLSGGGPTLVFTELGVFDFEPSSRRMRVKSVHPGITIDEIKARTGFELEVSDGIATTEAPKREELEHIRRRIDPEGLFLEAKMSLDRARFGE